MFAAPGQLAEDKATALRTHPSLSAISPSGPARQSSVGRFKCLRAKDAEAGPHSDNESRSTGITKATGHAIKEFFRAMGTRRESSVADLKGRAGRHIGRVR